MDTNAEPEIVLYDLACTRNVCFSPVVWRIRLMLNYKQVPYKTIFVEPQDIEPTLKGLGVAPHESSSGTKYSYTVPAIHHTPTDMYIMDSVPISHFLESTYPQPRVGLTSKLGTEIETKALAAVGKPLRMSIVPREIRILAPSSQEYFRRTREAQLGCRLEDLLDPKREEQAWDAADRSMRAVSELIQTHKSDGPFVLGGHPSYTDFFLAGNIQFVRVVDEGIFGRFVKYPAFVQIYEACLPYMEKKN